LRLFAIKTIFKKFKNRLRLARVTAEYKLPRFCGPQCTFQVITTIN